MPPSSAAPFSAHAFVGCSMSASSRPHPREHLSLPRISGSFRAVFSFVSSFLLYLAYHHQIQWQSYCARHLFEPHASVLQEAAPYCFRNVHPATGKRRAPILQNISATRFPTLQSSRPPPNRQCQEICYCPHMLSAT